jgi:hypothetical protein
VVVLLYYPDEQLPPSSVFAMLAETPASLLNGVCPYYTMYPLDFPLRVLGRNAQRGDWVLDPFCGRGTTLFAARLLGLPAVGIDSSPIAIAIAQAKIASSSPVEILVCRQSSIDG